MKSLKENFSWMFVGNAFYAFTQWVQLLIITKFCTTTELGSFTFAIALATPIYMLASFQLRMVLIADVKREWGFTDYFSLRVFSISISLIVLLIFAFVSGFQKDKVSIIMLIAFIKATEHIGDIIYAQLQSVENMKIISLSMIIRGLLVAVGLFVGAYYFQNFVVGIFLMLFFSISTLIFFDYLFLKQTVRPSMIRLSLDKKRLFELFKKAFPLGIVLFLIALNGNVSKYIAEYFLGTDVQGIFSALSYIIVVGALVIGAVGHAFSPRMCQYIDNGNISGFKRLKNYFIVIAVSIGALCFLGSLVGGKEILVILFSEEIAAYSHVFILIMATSAAVYMAEAVGVCLTTMSVFKEQPYVYIAVLGINVVSCLLLIKPLGVEGLVYSTLISSLCCFLFLNYLVNVKLKKLTVQKTRQSKRVNITA